MKHSEKYTIECPAWRSPLLPWDVLKLLYGQNRVNANEKIHCWPHQPNPCWHRGMCSFTSLPPNNALTLEALWKRILLEPITILASFMVPLLWGKWKMNKAYWHPTFLSSRSALAKSACFASLPDRGSRCHAHNLLPGGTSFRIAVIFLNHESSMPCLINVAGSQVCIGSNKGDHHNLVAWTDVSPPCLHQWVRPHSHLYPKGSNVVWVDIMVHLQ